MTDLTGLRTCAGCGLRVYWANGGFWCSDGSKYGAVCGEPTNRPGPGQNQMNWWPEGAQHEALDLKDPVTVARWLEAP